MNYLMKFYFAFIIFLFLSCSDLKESNGIECTLVETPTSLSSCGVFSSCTGMKFQKASNNTFFIGLIHCPEFKGDGFFKAGNRYMITFRNDQLKKVCELTQNEYEEEKLATYLVDEITLK